MMKNKIIAQDKEDLQWLIKQEIELHGNHCDLNHIDISLVTNMSYLFNESQFNGDISDWNFSNVKDMENIFKDSVCEKPWWAIENNDKRKLALDNYQLMQKLEDKLNSKETIVTPKKNKI